MRNEIQNLNNNVDLVVEKVSSILQRTIIETGFCCRSGEKFFRLETSFGELIIFTINGSGDIILEDDLTMEELLLPLKRGLYIDQIIK